MAGTRFKSWFTVRRRKSVAMAVSGWMSLSLVLAFWPCCQAVADEHPPAAVSAEAGDRDHGNVSQGTEDPCRTWLDTADAALNTSPDVLLSGFELRIGHAIYVDSHDIPAVLPSARGGIAYHPSPPDPLPLYLRIQHLLI